MNGALQRLVKDTWPLTARPARSFRWPRILPGRGCIIQSFGRLKMNLLWSEEDFHRVALRTRISDRNLDACRDVLVEGMTPTDAATKHKIFISALSRATGTLREKREQLQHEALKQELEQSRDVMRLTAIQVAKNIVGADFNVKDAEAGRTYEGPVVVNTHGFVVQKVGRTGVLYDLDKFQDAPPHGRSVTISVPENGGFLSLVAPGLEKGPSKGVGR